MSKLDNTHVLFTPSISDLKQYIMEIEASQKIFLCDKNTFQNCYLKEFNSLDFPVITIKAGDYNKNFEQLVFVLEELLNYKADRNALLINLGGGMVSDIGGFAASVYKRGIRFINIPTTTLAMADASYGGKTGVNLGTVKNAVGSFHSADKIYIHTKFLKTLPYKEQLSGFVEVLKMLLLFDAKEWENFSVQPALPEADSGTLAYYINIALSAKKDVVRQDPMEKGLRKSLNYGHSIGHAIESVYNANSTEMLHGEAVCIGMQIENIIASKLDLMSENQCVNINNILSKLYHIPEKFENINDIIESLKNDKKNKNGKVLMTLLKEPENFLIDTEVPLDIVEDVLKSL